MSVCKHSVLMHKDSQANMHCQLSKHTLMLTTSVTLSLQLLDVSQMVKTTWRGVRQMHSSLLVASVASGSMRDAFLRAVLL